MKSPNKSGHGENSASHGAGPAAFSAMADRYRSRAVVQEAAAGPVFELLDIGPADDVLDLGCGPGHLTARIRKKTHGTVVGVDGAPGMIRAAREHYGHPELTFESYQAARLPYRQYFDAIFCNSVMQWFVPPEAALSACYRALRPGGRMVVQAPAKKVFCPSFFKAFEQVKIDPRTAATFARFKNPWTLLESADDYSELFRQVGFSVAHARMESVVSAHTAESAIGVFESGAAAGFLNPACYDVPLTAAYRDAFREIVAASLARQEDADGQLALTFFRVYVLAKKI